MQIGHTKNVWHFEEEGGGYPTTTERRLMAHLKKYVVLIGSL